MSLTTVGPSPLLAGLVKQYWALEYSLPEGQHHVQRVIPCGLPDFSFYFKDKPRVISSYTSLPGTSQVSGHKKNYLDLEISGDISLFSVVFHPQAMMLLFDFPMDVIFDQNVSLRDLFHEEIDQLESNLYEAGSFAERVRVAEAFLLEKISKREKDYEWGRVLHTIAKINQLKANVSVEQLASEACLSRKQFERTFSRFIGTSPKHFLRTIRFQNALFEKSKNPTISLTALAYECGYFDQSHMISEFKSFSGMTPGKYFYSGEAFSDYFND